MDIGNTKQEILNASLNLFSIQGFEATSISQIAEVVRIRKASLYSHFESKQAILDALFKEGFEQYEKNSIFARANESLNFDNLPTSPEEMVHMIQEQIKYLIHNSYISKARKMLVIEQFRNPELSSRHIKKFFSIYKPN